MTEPNATSPDPQDPREPGPVPDDTSWEADAVVDLDPKDAQAPGFDAVVVGVDGSDQSFEALAWGAAEAGRRDKDVEVVMSYAIPTFAATAMDAGYAALDDETLRHGAEQVLREALEDLDRRRASNDGMPYAPADRVRAYVETGDAAGTLLEYGRNADLMVLGAHGRGGFLGRILGSVSAAVPPHSQCATVVVPKDSLARPAQDVDDVIVVGVDGSERARVAMLAAAEEAAMRGSTVHVLWALPPLSGTQAWVASAIDKDAVRAEMEQQLAAATEWLEHYFPNVRVTTEVAEGIPAEVLVHASAHARMIVTGTRGRGGFAGMLLGSTSQQVLQGSKAPVFIVPSRYDKRVETRPDFGPMPDEGAPEPGVEPREGGGETRA